MDGADYRMVIFAQTEKTSLDFTIKSTSTQYRVIGLILPYILLTALYSATFLVDGIIQFLCIPIGLTTLVWVPGRIIAQRYLPNARLHGLDIVLGFGLNILFIQLLFIFSFFVHISVPLWIWLVLLNTMVVLSLVPTMEFVTLINLTSWKQNLGHMLHSRVVLIVIASLCIRTIIALIGSASFSPDAGLYFDYARNIVSGQFSSHIINDSSVISIGVDLQEVAHQSTTYLFALSFILTPSFINTPILILIIFGSLVVVATYDILLKMLGVSYATIGAFLVAFHPTLVYYSAVAYGPANLSLVFVMYVFLLFLEPGSISRFALFLIGLFLAIIESIWYTNFYVAVTLVFVTGITRVRFNRGRMVLLTISLFGALFGRIFVTSIIFYLVIWVILFLTFPVAQQMVPKADWVRYFPLLIALFIGIESFYIPRQLSRISAFAIPATGSGSVLVNALMALPDVGYVIQFMQFLLWHLTFPVLCFIFIALLTDYKKSEVRIFGSVFLAIIFGTLIVLSHIEPMRPEYLYTSGRFILSSIAVALFLCAIGLSKFYTTLLSFMTKGHKWRITRANIAALVIITVTIGIPYSVGSVTSVNNLSYVNPIERYGWQGLIKWVDTHTSSETRVLIDRAREFAWLSTRTSITLNYNSSVDSEITALQQVSMLSEKYNVDLLVIDSYTVQHWGHFMLLLHDDVQNNASVPLIPPAMNIIGTQNTLFNVPSLKFVYQTEENDHGDFVRIYQITHSDYNLVAKLQDFNVGWAASNGGHLIPIDQGVELVIGPHQNYTNLWRPSGFDLDVPISGGFLICNITEINSTVSRVGVWNSEGQFVTYAERLNNSIFYCYIGSTTIGDVHVVIKGVANSSVIINSINFWSST